VAKESHIARSLCAVYLTHDNRTRRCTSKGENAMKCGEFMGPAGWGQGCIVEIQRIFLLGS
jgi:hypothetical protein